MSKNIKSSLSRFTQAQPLGRKQPSGAMPKRDAQAVTHKALRLLAKPVMINGNLTDRRGFETVYDAGIERVSLYCLKCGCKSKPKDEICRICKTSFVYSYVNEVPRLSADKFRIKCRDCRLPFYTQTMSAIEAEFKSIVGYRSEVCNCFLDAKEKYLSDLRRDRRNRKIYLQNKRRARKDVRLIALLNELTEAKAELSRIKADYEKTKLRFEQKALSRQKALCLKRINEIESKIQNRNRI